MSPGSPVLPQAKGWKESGCPPRASAAVAVATALDLRLKVQAQPPAYREGEPVRGAAEAGGKRKVQRSASAVQTQKQTKTRVGRTLQPKWHGRPKSQWLVRW